jgi:signal peptidase II
MLYLVFGLTAGLIVLFDQLTKLWISSNLYVGQTLWSWGFIHIIYVQNTGAAFGLFPGHFLPLVILRTIGAVIIISVFIIYGRRLRAWAGIIAIITLGLLLGGTLGNLIDQIRQRFVVDFIDTTYWPVFNVADSAVSVSAIIIAILLIIYGFKQKKTA